jgi:hypothetical protein
MRGDALVVREDFDRRRCCSHLGDLTGELVRDAVVVALELHVFSELGGGCVSRRNMSV